VRQNAKSNADRSRIAEAEADRATEAERELRRGIAGAAQQEAAKIAIEEHISSAEANSATGRSADFARRYRERASGENDS
jgi:hypothetical protein